MYRIAIAGISTECCTFSPLPTQLEALQTLVKADLSTVPVAGVGGALLLSALAISLLCLALRPLLAHAGVDGPAFTSIFQGATRWQNYVALSVSASLFGNPGRVFEDVGKAGYEIVLAAAVEFREAFLH